MSNGECCKCLFLFFSISFCFAVAGKIRVVEKRFECGCPGFYYYVLLLPRLLSVQYRRMERSAQKRMLTISTNSVEHYSIDRIACVFFVHRS